MHTFANYLSRRSICHRVQLLVLFFKQIILHKQWNLPSNYLSDFVSRKYCISHILNKHCELTWSVRFNTSTCSLCCYQTQNKESSTNRCPDVVDCAMVRLRSFYEKSEKFNQIYEKKFKQKLEKKTKSHLCRTKIT